MSPEGRGKPLKQKIITMHSFCTRNCSKETGSSYRYHCSHDWLPQPQLHCPLEPPPDTPDYKPTSSKKKVFTRHIMRR